VWFDSCLWTVRSQHLKLCDLITISERLQLCIGDMIFCDVINLSWFPKKKCEVSTRTLGQSIRGHSKTILVHDFTKTVIKTHMTQFIETKTGREWVCICIWNFILTMTMPMTMTMTILLSMTCYSNYLSSLYFVFVYIDSNWVSWLLLYVLIIVAFAIGKWVIGLTRWIFT